MEHAARNEVSSALPFRGLFMLHEMVGNHVADNEMRVFDSPHVLKRHVDADLGRITELATGSPCQTDCLASDTVPIFDGTYNVERIARAANRHHQILGL